MSIDYKATIDDVNDEVHIVITGVPATDIAAFTISVLAAVDKKIIQYTKRWC